MILQIAALCVFWGRAWQHWFWDAPFRTLLWDESWMRGLVRIILGMDWQDYVTSSAVEAGIQSWIRLTGWIYFLAGWSSLLIGHLGRVGRLLIWIGMLNLLFLAFLYYKERFFATAQFFEYSLQFLTPAFLLYFHRAAGISRNFLLFMKISIALTFSCHGLYAVGYYPRPLQFQEMVINILQLEESGAIFFLNAAGILDFVISIMLFLPWKRVQILALLYAVFWGFSTAIARVWAFVHWEYFWSGMHQWWFESVYRFPHFLVPFAVLLLVWKGRQRVSTALANQVHSNAGP